MLPLIQLREIQLNEELQSKDAEIMRLREEPRMVGTVCMVCYIELLL